VATQWIELAEVTGPDPEKDGGNEPREKDKEKEKEKKKLITTIADVHLEDELKRFGWKVARYPTKKSLPEIVNSIKITVIQAEKELRDRQLEYGTICQKINQLTANESGNLLTRDINTVIKSYNKDKPVEQHFKPVEDMILPETSRLLTELQYPPFLTTLYVVVPKSEQKNWERSYSTLFHALPDKKQAKEEKKLDENEKLPIHYIVPNSSVKLDEDQDSVLNSIIVFTKDIEEFKTVCRGKRYTVRKNDPTITINEKEKANLLQAAQSTRGNVKRWAKTTFQNIYEAWLHLKCIQSFVESILRYGLPANFEAILVLPKKGSEKKLIKNLCKIYDYLAGGFNDREDDAGGSAGPTETEKAMVNEKYFPFVHLDINMALT